MIRRFVCYNNFLGAINVSKSNNDDIEQLVLKYTLENSVKHEGVASEKKVMQKIMATHAELRKHAKQIGSLVENTVTEINKLSIKEQTAKLEDIAPELLERRGKITRTHELPELENAVKGEVVTRYAPEPNGDMHLGHAYTAFFAYSYAEKYDGTFILRFEDTNPKQERIEYMDAHREALDWLGLPPTKEVIVSNDMLIFYKKAMELINNNHAYTCTCPVDEMRELRAQMKLCSHAKKTPKEIMIDWKKMIAGEYNEGDIVLRLRGDMKSQNAVMRDPAIFTIRKDEHCIQKRKFNVWPLYDFAVAVEDNICGITHVGRSAEFDTRIELQNKIRELLDLLPHPIIFHYARFNVIGSPASKRKIIPLVEEGKVEGWDDIRLVTIKGFKRRGIVPETIKQIAKEVGMTTQPTNIDWSLIAATNRKIIDPITNRYFFVENPIILLVKNAPKSRKCKLYLHPDDRKRGYREITTSNLFLISNDDYSKLKTSEEFRLKDLYNVKLEKKDLKLEDLVKIDSSLTDDDSLHKFLKKFTTCCIAEYTDEELKPGKKIQWTIAHPRETVPIEVKVPDVLFIDNEYNEDSLKIVQGIGEKAIKTLEIDTIVQFERFGFIKIERKTKSKIFVNLAHK
ncbi:MAG: glutamate--tRNA ligase [Asgard group archaeon]|nr:glutamate--tRNA ligase [Asgard group archaeon]